MKLYHVNIEFDNALIYQEDIKANNKREAAKKAKQRLAKKLFKESKLKTYDVVESCIF